MKVNVVFKKILKYIKNPRRLYIRIASNKLKKEGSKLTDEEYLSKLFRISFNKELNLQNPHTFNEKMQWLKLFNRDPVFTMMVDKHLVKDYVSKIIGNEHVAKEYGCWDSFKDIDFSILPDSFVLKTTHGCGSMFICKDKKTFPFNECGSALDHALIENYYYNCREWPYKDVPPKIIAEEFLKDENNDILPVYKFFCFNGEPFLLQSIQNDKQDNETIDYFDMDWNNLHIKQNHPNSKKPLSKPNSFSLMKEYCKKLSRGIPFVRCDFYDVNGKVYFSEFTFFSDAGFEPYHPKKWDLILGEKIDLSIVNKHNK